MDKKDRDLKKISLLILSIVTLPIYSYAATTEKIENPCLGNSELLSVMDRPTVADSSCIVPYKKAIIEMGYRYLNLTANGRGQDYPETEVRIGLPSNNEIRVLLPNYNIQTSPSQSGFSAESVGFKHQIGYTKRWVGTIDALVTMPAGSANFGSNGYEYMLGGIVSYDVNDKLSFSLMLSISSLTQASSDGGGRYFTVNPDFVVTYLTTPNLQFYGEIYGQSRTGPGEKSGFNFDGGVQYLINHCFEVDTEIGQRINGDLNLFNHYIGVGLGILFA